MTSNDHDYASDERFERLLIDSAQQDELPSNVDAAWNKFGAALSGASLLAAGAAGALAVRRAERWLAAKWLIWGALTGSALTALSLRPSHNRQSAPSAVLSTPLALPAVASALPTVGLASKAQLPIAPASSKPKPAPHSSPRPRAPAARSEPATSPNSTLGAQVALLDAARTAIAAGAFAEALRLSERYRAEFPSGELAPEAEVVAIEALVFRGEKRPAAERAARFFARYPGDPHTARVKWLVR
jgi:hypothetical protein